MIQKKFSMPIKTIRRARKQLAEKHLINYLPGHQSNTQNYSTTYTIFPDTKMKKRFNVTTRGAYKGNVNKK
jgi:hypothetical protein